MDSTRWSERGSKTGGRTDLESNRFGATATWMREICAPDLKPPSFMFFPAFTMGFTMIYHHSWWGGLRVLEIVQRDCRTWVPAWWQTSSSRLLRLPEKTMDLKKSERPRTFLDDLSFPHGEHVEVSHWFSWFSPFIPYHHPKSIASSTPRCFFLHRGPRIFPAEIGSQGLCLPRPPKCPRPQIPAPDGWWKLMEYGGRRWSINVHNMVE